MADAPVSPIKESATTREEMDFEENEHEQETGRVSPLGTESHSQPAAKPASPKPRVSFQEGHQEIPPPKPPRPLSPQQQAENTLIEAFPSIDTKVVKGVLHASNGRVEPAFNALLGMSDPDFQADEAPPPQPPRPAQRQPQTQLEADEMYARQLAEQFNGSHPAPRGQAQFNQREPGRRGPNQQRPPYDDDDRERSFLDDDLPEIGKTIQQGFMDTQKKVNGWINTFRKRIDGEDDEDEDLYTSSQPNSRQNTRQNFGSSQSEQMHGIRKSAEAQQRAPRRSTEAQRYDADPHELGDDEFERLELRDEEMPPPQPPRTSSRKSANPDLFKSQPKPPQSGPVDEVDAADRRSAAAGQDPGKAKKWQPLTSVAPHPTVEEDNDPFSLGDDEEDAKTEEVRKEDSERLKKTASNSVSAGGGEEPKKTLQESERSGSINVEAAELLGGKKE
ncbi:ubiquitin-binding protein cue5 [Teratosphaeriaceae sp. CCFEE 6253]|nr:ubiquitin-binding protein cue5 [Teratosphaeriaceae sp. CCFEE 6253]